MTEVAQLGSYGLKNGGVGRLGSKGIIEMIDHRSIILSCILLGNCQQKKVCNRNQKNKSFTNCYRGSEAKVYTPEIERIITKKGNLHSFSESTLNVRGANKYINI